MKVEKVKPEPEKSLKLPRILATIGLWCLCFVFPGIFLGTAFQTFRVGLREKQETEVLSSLQTKLRNLIFWSDSRSYVSRCFLNKLQPGEPPPKLKIQTDGSTASGFSQLDEIKKFLDRKLQPDPDQIERWKNAFGWSFDPVTLLKNPRKPLQASFEGRETWLIWERTDGAIPGFDARLQLIIPPDIHSRIRAGVNQNFLSASSRFAVIDMKNRRLVKRGSFSNSEILDLQRSSRNGKGQKIDDTTVSIFSTVSTNVLVFIEKTLSRHPIENPAILWGAIVFFLLLSLVGVVLFLRTEFDLPVAWKLRLSVALLAGTPLIVFFPLLFQMDRDRLRVLKLQSQEKAWQELLQIDRNFINEENRLKKQLLGFHSQEYWSTTDLNVLFSELRNLFQKKLLSSASGFGWNGKRLLAIFPVIPEFGLDLIVKLTAEKEIKKAFGQFTNPAMRRNFDLAMELIESPLFGVTAFAEGGSNLNRTRIGKKGYYSYLIFKNPSESKALAVLRLTVMQQQLINSYLKRILPPKSALRFLARDGEFGRWLPGRAGNDTVEKLAEEIQRTQESLVTSVHLPEGKFLFVGIPGQQLLNFVLVALIREDQFNREGFFQNRKVFFAFLLFYILGTYFLLSQTTLRPIQDISLGLDALRRRQTDYEIPTRENDEFGLLAMAFNRMLETAKELDVAKVVQKTLQLSSTPKFPGFSAAFSCQMPNGIGGNYIDCLILSETLFAILVGDVFSKGVDAPLTMAMAKSLAFIHFHENRAPQALLPFLNKALLRVQGKRQMMAITFLLLDTETSTGRLFTAGSPFPFFFRKNSGVPIFLGIPRLPVGTRSTQPFKDVSLQFNSGDLLLLYNTGLINQLSPAQEPLGYEKIPESFSLRFPCTAMQGDQQLGSLLARHVGAQGVKDDLTYFFLMKNSELEDNLP